VVTAGASGAANVGRLTRGLGKWGWAPPEKGGQVGNSAAAKITFGENGKKKGGRTEGSKVKLGLGIVCLCRFRLKRLGGQKKKMMDMLRKG